ncbi:MAG: hypothetical protein IKX62_06960 [Bacteroidales bacterium]|nr:hypothetical protein [Bacteroidales bacterium]
MRRSFIIFLLFPVLLCACNAISSLVHDDQVVAKVGSNKLYKSELERFIPNMIPAEDSARLAEQYINTWAMDLLYLDVAERELSKGELDVSSDLEDFRRSLLKYRYEQRYINDRLDTLVTDEQIRQYYLSHEADFELKRPVLKVRFVDVMKDSPNKDAILKMMRSKEYDDVQRADTLAKSTALRYFDSADTWMDASELAKSFGLDYTQMLSCLKGDMIRYEPEDRADLMAAYVLDIQRKGTAPLEFCSARIRDILMSARKHDLMTSLERDLLENALESKQFVIYRNEE